MDKFIDDVIFKDLIFVSSDDNEADNKVGNPNHDKLGRFSSGTGSSIIASEPSSSLFRNPQDNVAVDTADKFIKEQGANPEEGSKDATFEWVSEDSFRDIQSYTKGDSNDEDIAVTVEDLDIATNGFQLKSDLTTYRGMALQEKDLEKFSAGKSMKIQTFASTSLIPGKALHAAKFNSKDSKQPVLARVKFQQGQNGIFVDNYLPTGLNGQMQEFLPSRNTTYKVTDVKKVVDESGTYKGGIIDMEATNG